MLCHRNQLDFQSTLWGLGMFTWSHWLPPPCWGLHKGQCSCQCGFLSAQSPWQGLTLAVLQHCQSSEQVLQYSKSSTLSWAMGNQAQVFLLGALPPAFSKTNGARSKPCFSIPICLVFFPYSLFHAADFLSLHFLLLLSLLPSLSPSPCFLSLCTLWTVRQCWSPKFSNLLKHTDKYEPWRIYICSNVNR